MVVRVILGTTKWSRELAGQSAAPRQWIWTTHFGTQQQSGYLWVTWGGLCSLTRICLQRSSLCFPLNCSFWYALFHCWNPQSIQEAGNLQEPVFSLGRLRGLHCRAGPLGEVTSSDRHVMVAAVFTAMSLGWHIYKIQNKICFWFMCWCTWWWMLWRRKRAVYARLMLLFCITPYSRFTTSKSFSGLSWAPTLEQGHS